MQDWLMCRNCFLAGSCLSWNMQRRCLNANTSLCVSRKNAMTEVHFTLFGNFSTVVGCKVNKDESD